MKKARRFMAMLLFLTLCIIPLSLSVQAHEPLDGDAAMYNNRAAHIICSNCGHNGFNIISYGTLMSENVSSSTVCYRKYYDVVTAECGICNTSITLEDVIVATYPHSNIHYTTEVHNGREITAWHCPTCDYYHN